MSRIYIDKKNIEEAKNYHFSTLCHTKKDKFVHKKPKLQYLFGVIDNPLSFRFTRATSYAMRRQGEQMGICIMRYI